MATMIAMAQNYTLEGSVEPVVHVGENFKLRYTLNTTDGTNFRLGSLPDALEILIGPSQSTSISSVTINGRSTTSRTLTLTYVVSASETGKFTIPPASVSVEGNTVKSQPLTVQVIAGNQHSGSQASGQSSPNVQRLTSKDFFVLVTANKKHVSEYEPFLLTFKVCWHPDVHVINLDDISLELQNVYMQPYNDTQQKSKKVEQIGGRTLVTVDWKQYVVYPQKPGKLEIPSMKFMGYIRQEMAYDPFDPFSANYTEVPHQLVTPVLDIQVDELPTRPDDFSGGVGQFKMEASVDKNEVAENTPVTLTVKVSGKGNLNMLKAPLVTFPRTFDTYDTKQNENFKLTAEGIDGELFYEYVAVPQREGTYTINPASLVYYDSNLKNYRTLTTDSFLLKVVPGDHNNADVRDYFDQGNIRQGDIRNIKTGPQQPKASFGEQGFFGSMGYLLSLLLVLIAFALLFIIIRQRAAVRADLVGARGKHANKVAVHRMRKAAKLMKAGNTSQFYDETLRALWGYVGDKLNIPVSQLTRDNISQRLEEHGVETAVTAVFIEAIDDCEFIRYAPGDPQGNMGKVYEKSIDAIERIDERIKKKKSRK